MPIEFKKCIDALISSGKSKDSAYAICTAQFKERHGGKTPQEMAGETKHSLDITVESLEGIIQVDIKNLDEKKGVSIITDLQGNIKQYRFDLENESNWTEETAIGYINKILQKASDIELPPIKQASLPCIFQAASGEYSVEKVWELLPEDFKKAVQSFDPEPLKGIGVLRVKYGEGSLGQVFEKPFFEKAGHKFEKTKLFVNHSNIEEFGNGIPIGTFPKFLGAKEDGADFAYYVSPSEGTWRGKIKESVALGDYGYSGRISIEGRPKVGDFTIDGRGRSIFSDLSKPSGMALVNFEGMKGSQIIL